MIGSTILMILGAIVCIGIGILVVYAFIFLHWAWLCTMWPNTFTRIETSWGDIRPVPPKGKIIVTVVLTIIDLAILGFILEAQGI